MDYLLNRKTGKSYYSQFIEKCGSDIRMRVEKAIAKIEKGNMGNVTRLTFKFESFYAPLYEYEIDYKQGFRIYFISEKRSKMIMMVGVKKNQKKDIKFCCEKYKEKMMS